MQHRFRTPQNPIVHREAQIQVAGIKPLLTSFSWEVDTSKGNCPKEKSTKFLDPTEFFCMPRSTLKKPLIALAFLKATYPQIP